MDCCAEKNDVASCDYSNDENGEAVGEEKRIFEDFEALNGDAAQPRSEISR